MMAVNNVIILRILRRVPRVLLSQVLICLSIRIKNFAFVHPGILPSLKKVSLIGPSHGTGRAGATTARLSLGPHGLPMHANDPRGAAIRGAGKLTRPVLSFAVSRKQDIWALLPDKGSPARGSEQGSKCYSHASPRC